MFTNIRVETDTKKKKTHRHQRNPGLALAPPPQTLQRAKKHIQNAIIHGLFPSSKQGGRSGFVKHVHIDREELPLWSSCPCSPAAEIHHVVTMSAQSTETQRKLQENTKQFSTAVVRPASYATTGSGGRSNYSPEI